MTRPKVTIVGSSEIVIASLLSKEGGPLSCCVGRSLYYYLSTLPTTYSTTAKESPLFLLSLPPYSITAVLIAAIAKLPARGKEAEGAGILHTYTHTHTGRKRAGWTAQVVRDASFGRTINRTATAVMMWRRRRRPKPEGPLQIVLSSILVPTEAAAALHGSPSLLAQMFGNVLGVPIAPGEIAPVRPEHTTTYYT